MATNSQRTMTQSTNSEDISSEINKGWLAHELPGYREHAAPATYSLFAYDDLPPIPVNLDDEFLWLVPIQVLILG